jgi:chorismate mutase
MPGRGAPKPTASPAPAGTAASSTPPTESQIVDLERRRDQLKARVAELQWDLGGLVYEMAIRDRIRVDVLVKRAALLQDADSELAEIERILRLEHSSTAGICTSCGAPHSTGASYCWQCGQPILQQVPSDSIFS